MLSFYQKMLAFFSLPELGYVRFLIFFGLFPTTLLFWIFHRDIARYIGLILLLAVTSVIVYIPWDLIALGDKVWYFIDYLNVLILGIPLEEYLFTLLFVLMSSGLTVAFKVWEEKHARSS